MLMPAAAAAAAAADPLLLTSGTIRTFDNDVCFVSARFNVRFTYQMKNEDTWSVVLVFFCLTTFPNSLIAR